MERSQAVSESRPTSSKDAAEFLPICPWDVGDRVLEAQDLLTAHGFPLKLDGDFGWKTEAAIRAFQREQHLRIDGIIGQETWGALIRGVQPGSRELRLGHCGSDVHELQGLLQVHNFVVARTGHFDDTTQQSVVQFQEQHHLRSHGRVDSVTWTLLRAGRPLNKPVATRRGWLPSFSRWW
ncbi:MAG: peptidoglycan-binding protein [Cyanobacteria bacterium J06638_22]